MASPAATCLGVHRLYTVGILHWRITRDPTTAGQFIPFCARPRGLHRLCTGRASWARDTDGPHPKYDTWVNRTQRFATVAPTLRFLRLVNDSVLLVDPLQLLLSPKRTRTNHATSLATARSGLAVCRALVARCLLEQWKPLAAAPDANAGYLRATLVATAASRACGARARLDMLERGRTEPPADEAPSKLTPRKGFATNELA